MLVVIIVIVIAAAAALNAPSKIENRVAPPATIVSDLGSGGRSAEEQAFLDGLKPYVDILMGEGRALQELGNSRSRNFFELSLRMDRYRTAASNIKQYVQDHPVPLRLTLFVSELLQRIEESTIAIDDSVDAFRSFEWEALGLSVSAFSDAIDKLYRLAATPVAEQRN